MQKTLTFFKPSHGWQILGRGLVLKQSKTALQNVALLIKSVKMKMDGQDEDLVDEEFNFLFNELVDPECDMTTEEYANFDVETCSSLPPIISDMVDWRVSSVKACVTEYLQKECGDVNEVALDSDDGKDDGGDNDDNEVNSKVVEIGTREALEMLDRLVNLKDLTKEERNSLVAVKDKLEIITIQNRKQSHIYDFFVC